MTWNPTSANAFATPGATCHDVTIPVALSEGKPRTYQLWGRLCRPRNRRPETVQVLLPGATYTSSYWDWPYNGARYSYVRHAVAGGYATLALDRIGHGRSSHPASTLVDTNANIFTVHQVVQDLRDGTLAHYQDIITVGHSFGSAIAMAEAAEHRDVNATILTGLLHKFSTSGIAEVTRDQHPAYVDALRFKNLDPGYLTTLPGTRGSIFYRRAATDPRVIAWDEATKDTVTANELSTFRRFLTDGTARRVNVPVLVVVGQDDRILCGSDGSDCSDPHSIQIQEASFFRHRYLHSYVLKAAGHDLNLQRNAPNWFEAARRFADRNVGPDGNLATISRTWTLRPEMHSLARQ